MDLSLIRRAIVAGGDDLPNYELPSWAWIVVLVDLIIVLPVFVILDYTLKTVYPVYAMVEDENPPAYEPVAVVDDAHEPVRRASKASSSGRARTVTSSLRAVNRLLMATGGVAANLRGLACALAQALMTSFLMGLFTAGLGGVFTPVATLLAALALVQFSTAWVHIVISLPSPLHFWQRLPPFKRTFDATWKPVTLYWLAAEVARWMPLVLATLMGLELPELQVAAGRRRADVRSIDAIFVVKSATVAFAALACSIFLVIPAKVILVRVQASLLPVQDDTIIPFDRSFDGKVEPAIVGGRGYVTMVDAWDTFTKAAWRRLLTLYVKIFFVSIAALLLLTALLLPEAIVIANKSVRVD